MRRAHTDGGGANDSLIRVRPSHPCAKFQRNTFCSAIPIHETPTSFSWSEAKLSSVFEFLKLGSHGWASEVRVQQFRDLQQFVGFGLFAESLAVADDMPARVEPL